MEITEHDTVEEIAAKAVAKKTATFDALIRKPKRVLEFSVTTQDESGDPVALQMKFQAMGGKDYDKLIEAHPPTASQKRQNASFNIDTFAPALIAAVSLEPRLSVEQAEQLWISPDWSGGEASSLYLNAQRVCNSGLDVPFNDRG
jgi:hypothetical protein